MCNCIVLIYNLMSIFIIFLAFLKVGIMDEESYKLPQSIQFQRAARTDKGVSAMRQIISLKMGEQINFSCNIL